MHFVVNCYSLHLCILIALCIKIFFNSFSHSHTSQVRCWDLRHGRAGYGPSKYKGCFAGGIIPWDCTDSRNQRYRKSNPRSVRQRTSKWCLNESLKGIKQGFTAGCPLPHFQPGSLPSWLNDGPITASAFWLKRFKSVDRWNWVQSSKHDTAIPFSNIVSYQLLRCWRCVLRRTLYCSKTWWWVNLGARLDTGDAPSKYST